MFMLRFVLKHFEKGIVLLIVLLFLAHVGLKIKQVIDEKEAHKALEQEAQALWAKVETNVIKAPPKVPAKHSGKAFDQWAKSPAMAPFQASAFYQERGGRRPARTGRSNRSKPRKPRKKPK